MQQRPRARRICGDPLHPDRIGPTISRRRTAVLLAALLVAAQLFMGQARAQDLGELGCPLQDRAPGSAIVVGRVLDAGSETPLPGAFVRLRWDGGVENRTTDPEGHFITCSVPTGVEIDARSHFPGRAASTTFTIGESTDIVSLELRLMGSVSIGVLDVESTVDLVIDTMGTAESAVVGSVVDEVTGAPLVGAQVAIADLGTGAVTDEEGRFRIPRLSPGRRLLTVDYLGYASASAWFDLGPGEGVTAEIRMKPVAIAVDRIEAVVSRRRRRAVDARELALRRPTSHLIDEDDLRFWIAADVAEIIDARVPRASYGGSDEWGCPVLNFGERLFPLVLGAPSTAPTPRVMSADGDVRVNVLQPSGIPPASTWDLNSRLVVVIDGVRHLDTCILNFVRPADIESIVVVPGIFGATTFGSIGSGAIVITTKDALRRPGEPTE